MIDLAPKLHYVSKAKKELIRNTNLNVILITLMNLY